MVRDIEAAFAEHRQKYPTSARTSLIEILLKLMGVPGPDLQATEAAAAAGWTHCLDQRYGHLAVRSVAWDEDRLPGLLTSELAAGRPVGLIVANPITGSGRHGERSWVAVRTNLLNYWLMADLRGKCPERGAGEGRFTESRVIRVDRLSAEDVTGVVYCEELTPRPRPRPSSPRERFQRYCPPTEATLTAFPPLF